MGPNHFRYYIIQIEIRTMRVADEFISYFGEKQFPARTKMQSKKQTNATITSWVSHTNGRIAACVREKDYWTMCWWLV